MLMKLYQSHRQFCVSNTIVVRCTFRHDGLGMWLTEKDILSVVSKGSNLVGDQYGLWRLARTSGLDTKFIQSESFHLQTNFLAACATSPKWNGRVVYQLLNCFIQHVPPTRLIIINFCFCRLFIVLCTLIRSFTTFPS